MGVDFSKDDEKLMSPVQFAAGRGGGQCRVTKINLIGIGGMRFPRKRQACCLHARRNG